MKDEQRLKIEVETLCERLQAVIKKLNDLENEVEKIKAMDKGD